MIRHITIGQYYPVDSLIHRLDARTKFISSFIFIILLFVANRFEHYAVLAFFLFFIIYLAKIPIRFMLKGLKPIVFLIVFALIVNLFFTPGDVVFSWKFISITKQGLYQGGIMMIRLILLIMSSSILTLSTSPIELTDAIESITSPLKRIGFPSHEIAMMMSIALRFIPTLLEETDKIIKAQMARGADFESGNILKRAKSFIPILVPLFISAFNRADELAFAMEARCYRGGVGRTKLRELKYQTRDYVSLALMVVVSVGIVLWRVL